MGDFEAVADAVTGGLIGRAVEPRAGEGEGHTHETHCLNCGAELVGPHCHQCGQHSHVHRSLAAFFHDFAHGVLHFEGKIWRTLPMLVWKPGELTRRYIEGQRASFVSPIALFLFCVFLMFAVMGWTGSLDEMAGKKSDQDLAAQVQQDQMKIAQLEAGRAELQKERRPTQDIDKQLSDVKNDLAGVQSVQQLKAGKINTRAIQISNDMPGWMRRLGAKAGENPQLLFYKIKTNAYKFSWALIPISVPFVWLLFPFSRRFKLYDHTVFVTYSLCFMMLLLSFGTLVALVSGTIAGLLWFVPPIHMYRQLRGTYQVGVMGAVTRTLALSIFAWIAIGLFASLLVTIGAID
jgi:hypothetical protein